MPITGIPTGDSLSLKVCVNHSLLISYKDGEKRYILHPNTLKVGDTIISGSEIQITTGNTLPLSQIPLGTAVHNIELILLEDYFLFFLLN